MKSWLKDVLCRVFVVREPKGLTRILTVKQATGGSMFEKSSRQKLRHLRGDNTFGVMGLLTLAVVVAIAILGSVVDSVYAEGGYTFVTKWGSQGTGNGQFASVYEVVVDSSGNVYVADSHNHRIQKFDSNGNFITKWGSDGGGDGQFHFPYGLAIDSSNNIYVGDTYNYRIQKFDSNGNFITKWGSQGTGDGQFLNGSGSIAVDSAGNVYAVDYYNARVHKFDSSGNFLLKWGSKGTGDGQFCNLPINCGPWGIAVDSSDKVYVSDYGQ
ncbi:cell surface protein [Candidatus Magnetobacterium bavaricum]|uniref:Cell surface protein n=1 Tax=Candidatus Magnetobacterium bavaricum TaxID=29290 RepID=A0A0F3GLJ8_9BACT|nr:cell surface protein [Candidatus Magnetobacterium bavaricum]